MPETGDPPSLEGLYSNDELTIARTRHRYWEWLVRHPDTDPDLLKKTVRPDTDIYDSLHRLLSHYKDQRLWWSGDGVDEVVDVEVKDARMRNVRIVRVYYHRDAPGRLIDAEGEVHDTIEPERGWTDKVWSREDAQSPWRLISLGDDGTWQAGTR